MLNTHCTAQAGEDRNELSVQYVPLKNSIFDDGLHRTCPSALMIHTTGSRAQKMSVMWD